MGRLTYTDFTKHNYDYANIFVRLVENGNVIHYYKGNKVAFGIINKNDSLIARIKNLILTKSQFDRTIQFKFTNGDVIRWTEISKPEIVNLRLGKNMNSNGDNFTTAAELATIKSLTKEIKTPKDTGQRLLINNPNTFYEWLDTFKHTKPTLIKAFGHIDDCDFIHVGTQGNNLIVKIFKEMRKISGAKNANNFCPADFFVIRKSKKREIIKKYKKLINSDLGNELKRTAFCALTYDLYKKREFAPISLKKINGTPKYELTNVPKEILPTLPNAIGLVCHPTITEGKEIGSITINFEENFKMRLQHKNYPPAFRNAQTEITHLGNSSGGRIGKVPIDDITSIMKKRGMRRCTINAFGINVKNNYMRNAFRTKEYRAWYEEWVTVSKRFGISNTLTRDKFKELFESANNDYESAKLLVNHIQGLHFLYFLVKNEHTHLSEIALELMLGGKKIGDGKPFFIKIYSDKE